MGKVAAAYPERLRARSHHVHVYTPRVKRQDTAHDPDYIHRLPSPLHIGNAGVMPSLFHRLAGFEIVHLHYPFFGGAEPVIVRKALRRHQKLVVTYHMDPVASGVKGMIFGAHRRLLFPWLMARADKILVSSKDYAAACQLSELENIEPRLEIHAFGVDTSLFYPNPNEISKEPTLIFVGGLDDAHHFKGVSVLLAALEKIKNLPWRCVIVGEGNLKSCYQEEAKENGLSDRVIFAGALDEGKLASCYRQAHLHIFPSTERAEAFGLVALEAAASGLPTIASDLPGVRSVVLNGETGLLVPPSDAVELAKAITLLLEQNDLRARLGASARCRVEADFSWEPLITKLEETYRHVLGS